jgi:hypothetical protein
MAGLIGSGTQLLVQISPWGCVTVVTQNICVGQADPDAGPGMMIAGPLAE